MILFWVLASIMMLGGLCFVIGCICFGAGKEDCGAGFSVFGILIIVVAGIFLGLCAMGQTSIRRSAPFRRDALVKTIVDYQALLYDQIDGTTGDGLAALGEGKDLKIELGKLKAKLNRLDKDIAYINSGQRVAWFVRPVDMSSSETHEPNQ